MGIRKILRRENRILQAQLRQADLRLSATQFQTVRRETKIARSELKGELVKLNNLRQEVIADRAGFILRGEYQAQHQALETLFRSEIAKLDIELRAEIKATNVEVAANTGVLSGDVGGRVAVQQFRQNLASNVNLILIALAVVVSVLAGHFLLPR